MGLKILQITPAYKPAYIYGGPTMSVAQLCETLVQIGVNLHVLTTTANGAKELNVVPNTALLVDGVKVTYYERITKDHTHFSPALLRALKQSIKAHISVSKTDTKPQINCIIHIHAWWNLVSIFSCSLAKFYNIPVVLSPRGMLTAYSLTNKNSFVKSTIHKLIGKKLLQYCHIHVTSEKEKADVLDLISPKSITVIPNLVSLLPIESPSLHKQSNPFKLIYLSRIEEKKGLELLFESLTNLPFEWQLTIAGSGNDAYLSALKMLAENLGISDRLFWIGQVKKENKFNLLLQQDLTTLTSKNENFANVVIESLHVGTPVLLSDQVGLANYVLEKQLGWVTVLDAVEIRNSIIDAFEDKLKRQAIKKMAPAIIAKDFSPTVLAKQYHSLYHRLINETGQN